VSEPFVHARLLNVEPLALYRCQEKGKRCSQQNKVFKLRSPFAIPPSDLETPADGCACKRRGLDFDGVDISPVARRCFRAVDEGGKIEIDGQQIRVV
jgi:hypothetical protein